MDGETKGEKCITKNKGPKKDTFAEVKLREKAGPRRVNTTPTSPSRGVKLLRAVLRSTPKCPSPPCYDRITWTSDAEGLVQRLQAQFYEPGSH